MFTIKDEVQNPEGISATDISYGDGTVAEALDSKQDAGKYAIYNGSGQTGASISTLTNERVQIVVNRNDESWLLFQIAAQAKQLSIITKDATGDPVTRATFTADEDTGWQTPDPTNLPNFKYRRKNGYVTVTGYGVVGAVEAKTSKILFTLPEGFRPSIRIDSAAHLANGSNDPVCQFLVTADGKVNVWANTAIAATTSVCGSVSFPV